MPAWLSYTDMPKSCHVYHVYPLISSIRSTSRFLYDAEHLSVSEADALLRVDPFSQDHFKLKTSFFA